MAALIEKEINMARNVMTFNNNDLVAHAMNGKMMVVRDGAEFSLVVENEVAYTNRTIEGLCNFLVRTAKRGTSLVMPQDCVKYATAFVTKIKIATR